MPQQCCRDRILNICHISQIVDRILCVFWLVFHLKYAYPYDAKSFSVTLNNYPHALAAAPWRGKAGFPTWFFLKSFTRKSFY